MVVYVVLNWQEECVSSQEALHSKTERELHAGCSRCKESLLDFLFAFSSQSVTSCDDRGVKISVQPEAGRTAMLHGEIRESPVQISYVYTVYILYLVRYIYSRILIMCCVATVGGKTHTRLQHM